MVLCSEEKCVCVCVDSCRAPGSPPSGQSVRLTQGVEFPGSGSAFLLINAVNTAPTIVYFYVSSHSTLLA